VQAEANRLLEQSTFGPNDALLTHVQNIGTQAFLNGQFAAAAGQYPAIKYVPAGQQATFCPTDPDPQCGRDYYSLFLLQNGFFQNALSANDQLRQRVAFALSQMLVTSGLDVNLAYGTATYQQIFLDNAFGNYEHILTKVTLSSVMGDYLNMVNNDKPANGVNPNENYAREVAASLFLMETRQALPILSTESHKPNPSLGKCFAPPAPFRSKRCVGETQLAGIRSCRIGLPLYQLRE
jgi:Protein of unknown function (DUF1800)